MSAPSMPRNRSASRHHRDCGILPNVHCGRCAELDVVKTRDAVRTLLDLRAVELGRPVEVVCAGDQIVRSRFEMGIELVHSGWSHYALRTCPIRLAEFGPPTEATVPFLYRPRAAAG